LSAARLYRLVLRTESGESADPLERDDAVYKVVATFASEISRTFLRTRFDEARASIDQVSAAGRTPVGTDVTGAAS
jgi:hypothetical protein